jgi:hypothetical protein
MIKLMVIRSFVFCGSRVDPGVVIDADSKMADYLLGLKKSPVEIFKESPPESDEPEETGVDED